MSSAANGIANWHKVIEGGSDPDALAEILRDDAVFHSPVVHTPQVGKPIVMAYLTAAGETLGNDNFTYLREVVDGDNAVFEFCTQMDGIQINGIDMITFDDEGKIKDFKVMVRPLKAINKVWEMMGKQLKRAESG